MTTLNTQGLSSELQQALQNRKVENGKLNLSHLGLTEDNLKKLINNNKQLFEKIKLSQNPQLNNRVNTKKYF